MHPRLPDERNKMKKEAVKDVSQQIMSNLISPRVATVMVETTQESNQNKAAAVVSTQESNKEIETLMRAKSEVFNMNLQMIDERQQKEIDNFRGFSSSQSPDTNFISIKKSTNQLRRNLMRSVDFGNQPSFIKSLSQKLVVDQSRSSVRASLNINRKSVQDYKNHLPPILMPPDKKKDQKKSRYPSYAKGSTSFIRKIPSVFTYEGKNSKQLDIETMKGSSNMQMQIEACSLYEK